MAIQVTGSVGTAFSADTDVGPPFRQGKTAEMIVSELHGKYYETSYRGNLFTACNVAAQAVSVALNTTYTGLCLSNPVGNNKNLVLVGGQYALSVAPVAIASLHLIAGGSSAGITNHGTPLAAPGIQSSLIGPRSGIVQATGASANVDSACTIVNPYYLVGLGSGFTAGALYATTPSLAAFDGMFIITPGGWVAWGALTAVTGFGSFVWEEVPV